jgi:hypothetical protein
MKNVLIIAGVLLLLYLLAKKNGMRLMPGGQPLQPGNNIPVQLTNNANVKGTYPTPLPNGPVIINMGGNGWGYNNYIDDTAVQGGGEGSFEVYTP